MYITTKDSHIKWDIFSYILLLLFGLPIEILLKMLSFVAFIEDLFKIRFFISYLFTKKWRPPFDFNKSHLDKWESELNLSTFRGRLDRFRIQLIKKRMV